MAFTVPMLIGNVAQQLYNTVDSIVVGKYVGDNALAAVGSASPIFNLLLVLFVGISMGAGIMVSQYFGSRDRENLSKTIGSSITLTAVASILLMIVGTVAIRPVLVLLDTPDSIIDWCTSYLMILLWGIAGLAYYNILCGILRGWGIPCPRWCICWWPRCSILCWMYGSWPDSTWACREWLWPLS